MIDNQKREFKNKNMTKEPLNSPLDYKDELEASNNVAVFKFKQWLLKSYIEHDHFYRTIENDINNLLSTKRINESQKDIIMQLSKSDPTVFIDFMIKDGIVYITNLDSQEFYYSDRTA
jgi:hypothetical protein